MHEPVVLDSWLSRSARSAYEAIVGFQHFISLISSRDEEYLAIVSPYLGSGRRLPSALYQLPATAVMTSTSPLLTVGFSRHRVVRVFSSDTTTSKLI